MQSKDRKYSISTRWIIVLGIIVFLGAMGLLLLPRDYTNDTMIFSALFMLIVIALSVFRVSERRGIVLNRNELFAVVFLTVILLAQLSGARLVSGCRYMQIGGRRNNYILMALESFSITAASFLAVGYAVRYVQDMRAGESTARSYYAVCLTVIILETIVVAVSAYPGAYLSNDVAHVNQLATDRQWDDWHTLGYLLYVFACFQIKHSLYTPVIAQSVIWIVLNAYVLDVLRKVNNKALIWYTAVICIVGTPFSYLRIMYKDTVFSLGILAVTAALFCIMYMKRVRVTDILMLCSVGLFALLCRHGGVAAVMVACLTAVLYFAVIRDRKSAIRLSAVCGYYLIVYLLITVVLFNALETNKNPSYIKYGTPMAMISGAAANGMEFSEEDTKTLEKVMPVERWAACYNKYWVDDSARQWGRIGTDIIKAADLIENEGYGLQLIKLNAKIVLQHPKTYLKCFFAMNSIVWEITEPADSYRWGAQSENDAIRYSLADRIFAPNYRYSHENGITRAFVGRGGVALFCMIFCTVISIINKRKELIIGLVPAGINTLLLLITIPAQDPRYVLPAMLSAAVYMSVLLSGGLTSEKLPINHNNA